MRGIKRVSFDNGLVLLMERRPYTKEVVILVGTKTGSVNESEENSGATHFIEHMLFRTNRWRTYQEITEGLESVGAEINAFTGQNFMYFYVKTVPFEISKTLQIIFEAVVNDQYQKEEFYKEKDDILSEIKICVEHPLDYLHNNLFLPTLFRGTPLERTIDGTIKTVSRMTLKKLIDDKKKIFIPNKPMIIVATGKVDEDNFIREVERTFGGLSRGVYEPEKKISLINQKARKIEEREEIDQVYLALGFKIPGLYHKDILKLGIIEGILGGGLSSRLFRELRDKRGIGYLADCSSDSFGEVGSFCCLVTVYNPERMEEAEGVITSELQDLKNNLITNKELEKAKNLVIRQYYSALEQLENRAARMMVHEFQNVPFDFRKIDYYIRRLSAKSIREAARKYLSNDYVLTALVPKGFKP